MHRLAPSLPASADPAPDRAGRELRIFIALMLAPALALLAAFTMLPFAVSVWLSATDYMLSNPPTRFIGLGNYVELLGAAEFWAALRRSAVFVTLAVTLETVAGLVLALALFRTAERWSGRLRTLFILPLAVTPVAAIFTFRMMLNPGLGVTNHLLSLVGLPAQDWLGSGVLAMGSLVIVDAWHWTPFMILILSGGLASLPAEPVEAARIDGAREWQVLRYVTLPMLMPFVTIAVLLRAIDALKAFDAFYILTGGGPGQSTTTLNVFAFKEALEFTALGRGSAIAILMMGLIILMSQLLLRRTRMLRIAGEGQ
ncbi:carbohydrate ABC transporter permease [Frigidibacter sp. MR17.24]|uniref:carbohydrate ABC transporter permease n=1 Tax=Frigidibacter sp. MR17.24 TaxID=3127345 RepID=UPI003012A68D